LTVLETDRLLLRRITTGDADFLLRHLNDPSFHQFIGDRGVRTVEQARHYIRERALSSYTEFGYGIYLVQLKSSGEPIGTCGLINRHGMDDVEVGFALLPAYWSHGYALEAAQAVMEYGYGELNLDRIVAIVNPGNHRSYRLLEKLGLRFERRIQLPADGSEVELFTPPADP
jgi:RimJ/RimL family protein N-acetyltransferase